MKWEMKEARSGDIVRVSLGKIYHFGIFVSEEDVIQFGLPPTPDRRSEDVEVLSSPVANFLAGGFLEVGICEGREKKRRKTPEETVAAAKRRLGERGYDILHNNCEHFVYECAFGEKFSSMTENIRTALREIPIVHVYVARFPFSVETETIVPPARAREIEDCSNPKVQHEKYYAWKLLEKALMRSLGLKPGSLDIRRSENGKWECSSCFFSLSHSGNFVAAAVSRKPIGVDIEKWDPSRFTKELANKMVTKREKAAIRRLGESERGTALNALWTKKEAIYKSAGDTSFQPRRIETSKYASATKAILLEDERYLITVVSEDSDQAVFRCEGLDIRDLSAFTDCKNKL